MLLIADFFDSVPYVELAVFRSVGGDYGHLLPQFRDSDLSPSAWDRIRALPPLCLVNALREIGLDAPAAGAALVTEVGDISSDLAHTAFDSTSYAADEVSHFVGSVAEEAARDSLRGVETAAVAVADGVVVAANSVAHAGETVAGGVQTAWKVVTGFLGGLFG